MPHPFLTPPLNRSAPSEFVALLLAVLGWAAPTLAADASSGHHAAEILPQVAELAGQLDLDDWAFRKAVGVETDGVQELELDLEVLAHAQTGFADLRLMLGDRQVPYILDRRSELRTFSPILRNVDNPDRPRHSVWSLQLPFPNLPIIQLTCSSSTALFRREVVIYEQARDPRGGRYRRELGRGSWIQTPDRTRVPLTIRLDQTPSSDTLFLETDNGDNPPIQLSEFELSYPMVRLYFKSKPGTDLFLYYGNARVGPPQYDLNLVAAQIIAADKIPAYLGNVEPLRAASGSGQRIAGKGSFLFWGALILVVAGLLFVMIRLVPKSSDSSP